MSATQGRPKDPIREALRVLCGKAPPHFVRGYSFRGLTDAQIMALQDWACDHVQPDWATGIGALDAAELIVSEAVSNGNIPGPEERE
jgi:hypothetical protein